MSSLRKYTYQQQSLPLAENNWLRKTDASCMLVTLSIAMATLIVKAFK